MKDAYSFHANDQCLRQTYELMHSTYSRIFQRTGLVFRAVIADTGSIGGSVSHEFHVLAESGEDAIVFSNASDYAANIEKATALPPRASTSSDGQPMEEISTPNVRSIGDLVKFLSVDIKKTIKTLVVSASAEIGQTQLFALVLRGDHELNPVKAQRALGLDSEVTFASEEQINHALGCGPGSIGPVGADMPLFVDRDAAVMHDFVSGANRDGFHLTNVNWDRDCGSINVVDIRNVVSGDSSPDGKGTLEIKRGIEVGHIFQLGTKYSESMKATVLDENGKEQFMSMGCYGIGVSRIVAAAIEQNYDNNGIIWPEAIAPFQIALVPINMHKSEQVKNHCENLYRVLTELGYEVLFMDEPKARLGGMLADVELIGIPHRLVVGDRGLADNMIEYRHRTDSENQYIECDKVIDFLAENSMIAT
jgi:prolyl-tRNA synthetase